MGSPFAFPSAGLQYAEQVLNMTSDITGTFDSGEVSFAHTPKVVVYAFGKDSAGGLFRTNIIEQVPSAQQAYAQSQSLNTISIDGGTGNQVRFLSLVGFEAPAVTVALTVGYLY